MNTRSNLIVSRTGLALVLSLGVVGAAGAPARAVVQALPAGVQVVPCDAHPLSWLTSYNVDCRLAQHWVKDAFGYKTTGPWVGPGYESGVNGLTSYSGSYGTSKQYYS